jgi:hypothetical protein
VKDSLVAGKDPSRLKLVKVTVTESVAFGPKTVYTTGICRPGPPSVAVQSPAVGTEIADGVGVGIGEGVAVGDSDGVGVALGVLAVGPHPVSSIAAVASARIRTVRFMAPAY